jgi:hypothetical protein
LLALAQEEFDAFVTLDKGILYQHPLGRYRLRIVRMKAASSKISVLLPLVGTVSAELAEMKPGEVRELPSGG